MVCRRLAVDPLCQRLGPAASSEIFTAVDTGCSACCGHFLCEPNGWVLRFKDIEGSPCSTSRHGLILSTMQKPISWVGSQMNRRMCLIRAFCLSDNVLVFESIVYRFYCLQIVTQQCMINSLDNRPLVVCYLVPMDKVKASSTNPTPFSQDISFNHFFKQNKIPERLRVVGIFPVAGKIATSPQKHCSPHPCFNIWKIRHLRVARLVETGIGGCKERSTLVAWYEARCCLSEQIT